MPVNSIAYSAGWNAYRAGKSVSENTYTGQDALDWLAGYRDSQRDASKRKQLKW